MYSKYKKDSEIEQLKSFIADRSKQNRNRLLLLLLFTIYSLLAVLGTKDLDLFMENPILLPFFNVELPLLAFYIFVPLFIVVIHFFSLQMHANHIEYLSKQNIQVTKDIPFSIYDLPYVKNINYLKYILGTVIYGLPLSMLVILYFRFSDYQNSVISNWHLLLIFGDSVIIVYFGKHIIKYIAFLFYLSVGLFHKFFFIPLIENPLVTYKKFNLDTILKEKIYYHINISELLMPRLTIEGKNFNNDSTDILMAYKELEKNTSKPLLYYKTYKIFKNRNFIFAKFNNIRMINFSFENVNFAGATFENSMLNHDIFNKVSLIGTNIEFSDINDAQIHYCDFNKTKITYTSFNRANMDNVYFSNAFIKETFFSGISMQNVAFIKSNLNNINFKCSNSYYVYYADTNLTNSNFNGSIFINVSAINTSFKNSTLLGIYVENLRTNDFNKTFKKLSNKKLNKIEIDNLIKQCKNSYAQVWLRKSAIEQISIDNARRKLYSNLKNKNSLEWLEIMLWIDQNISNKTKDDDISP